MIFLIGCRRARLLPTALLATCENRLRSFGVDFDPKLVQRVRRNGQRVVAVSLVFLAPLTSIFILVVATLLLLLLMSFRCRLNSRMFPLAHHTLAFLSRWSQTRANRGCVQVSSRRRVPYLPSLGTRSGIEMILVTLGRVLKPSFFASTYFTSFFLRWRILVMFRRRERRRRSHDRT